MEIKQKFNHSKIGNFMFKLCAVATKYLVKHKLIYYVLSFTWGLPMTFIGLFLSLIYVFLTKVFLTTTLISKNKGLLEIRTWPKYWGGFNCGIVYFRDLNSTESLSSHEIGHSFQNCIFGPFMLIIVVIPSIVRYWYHTIRELLGFENKPYDKAWFEDSATQCGEYAVKN